MTGVGGMMMMLVAMVMTGPDYVAGMGGMMMVFVAMVMADLTV